MLRSLGCMDTPLTVLFSYHLIVGIDFNEFSSSTLNNVVRGICWGWQCLQPNPFLGPEYVKSPVFIALYLRKTDLTPLCGG